MWLLDEFFTRSVWTTLVPQNSSGPKLLSLLDHGQRGVSSRTVRHDPKGLIQLRHRNLGCRTLVSGEDPLYAVAVWSRIHFFFSDRRTQLRDTEDFSVGGDGEGNVRVAADYTGQSYSQLYIV